MRSVLLGTAALTALLVASAVLSVRRPLAADPLARSRVRGAALLAVGIHLAHFTEEALGGFASAFPALLGLPPWGQAFFTSFNVAWVAIWLTAVSAVRRGVRVAEWPLWFLGLASAANGVAHPALAVVSRGYFPGLFTSPLVGIAGLILLRALLVGGPRAEGRMPPVGIPGR